MPELPEVETLARGLRDRLLGDEFSQVSIRWPRIVASPDAESLERDLPGRRIVALDRRGKFITIRLHPHGFLLVHLRMTGQLLWYGPGQEDESAQAGAEGHCHVVMRLRSGAGLLYRDQRKFGRLYLVDDPLPILGKLGPEPLSEELTEERFGALMRGKRTRIKPLLLDQRILAGLGNIYVDESLWHASIHPLRQACTLGSDEARALRAAVREVLACAIDNRGTTLRDYCDAQGKPGHNRDALAVYGRAGSPCGRCGNPIERIVVNGRGTHYCPRCQPDSPSD